ncbi:MAG TPA: flippase [Solirubrobacteraceae bacterium]|jgi:O-antigen/teichoic acid export membrane protein|nr:flippase [Solirubrobacteraceae bacterium]
MTNLLRSVSVLPRRLLHGGAAGDAGAAGARLIASNTLIQIAARVITMAVGVVTVALTARTLKADGYGVWSGVSNYTGLFAVLTDLGFVTVATQRMATEPDREAEWLGALVGVRTVTSLIVAAICAASIPLFLRSTGGSHAVAYIMTTTMLVVGPASLLAVFQSRLRSGIGLSFTVLQWLIWLAAVVVLHAEHASVVAFAIVNALILFFISALQIQACRRFVDIAWRAGLRLWRPLLRQAIPLGVATVMITIYYQVDSVLLLQLAGAKETGVYGAAYGFLGPLVFLPAAVMGSFFPVLSAIHKRDPGRARRLVQVCADVMAVIGLPILAGAIALSGPIVHLVYGSEFARASGLLPILMIAFVVICYGTLAGNLSILLGLQWRFAAYTTIGAVANVVLNLALIPPFGAYGSAWATVVTESITMVLMLVTGLRTIRLRLRPGKMLRAVVLAAGMTATMILARPLGLIPAGTIGVLAYVGGLFALRIVNRDELRALMGRGEADPDLLAVDSGLS